jgi:hypothetical protein
LELHRDVFRWLGAGIDRRAAGSQFVSVGVAVITIAARCATVAPIGEAAALAAMPKSGRHPTGRFGPFPG